MPLLAGLVEAVEVLEVLQGAVGLGHRQSTVVVEGAEDATRDLRAGPVFLDLASWVVELLTGAVVPAGDLAVPSNEGAVLALARTEHQRTDVARLAGAPAVHGEVARIGDGAVLGGDRAFLGERAAQGVAAGDGRCEAASLVRARVADLRHRHQRIGRCLVVGIEPIRTRLDLLGPDHLAAVDGGVGVVVALGIGEADAGHVAPAGLEVADDPDLALVGRQDEVVAVAVLVDVVEALDARDDDLVAAHLVVDDRAFLEADLVGAVLDADAHDLDRVEHSLGLLLREADLLELLPVAGADGLRGSESDLRPAGVLV